MAELRVILPLACALWAGCAGTPPRTGSAIAWPEADQLFRNDPRWLGSDAAYSVDLGGGRVLWQFGDSFIANDAQRLRSSSTFVRNSVAIQRGYDPSAASIRFYWNGDAAGKPSSFIPERGAEWSWPEQGIRLGDRLLLFYSRVGKSTDGLGFQNLGWDALLVDNPDAEPSAWAPHFLAAPANPWRLIVGAGGVQVDGDFLYAYAVQEPGHDLFLTRWPLASAKAGDLSAPEWWNGGFVAQAALTGAPAVVIPSSGTEFSVHRDGRWIEIETQGFGAAVLVARFADRLEGPFSTPTQLYRPPESDRANILVYAGKAHPELTGAPLIATYASNSFDFATLVNDMSLYYPRFVRITLR